MPLLRPDVSQLAANGDVDKLIETMNHWNPKAREEAIRALREMQQAVEIEPLIHASTDRQEGVRTEAAWSLGELNDPRAYQPLLDLLLNDSSEIVRARAAISLGILGDNRAVNHLINTFNYDSHFVRLKAIEALGLLGDTIATPVLMRAFKDSSFEIRQTATEALKNIS